MIYSGNYMLLDSNDDVFIILTDREMNNFFPDIMLINEALWLKNKILIKSEEYSLEIPILNSSDVLLLNKKEKMISFIDKNGDVINILEIKGV